ncbi:MAG: RluA family pseudouridine synthase [Erysipelothrix sp.]|nr:RluA family pseudouridine synthase [Erysipelothrix sp.]
MSIRIQVSEEGSLLDYVLKSETGYSRSKLKSLLKNDCFSINDQVTTQFNQAVKPGDIIKIQAFNKRAGIDFEIVYEDEEIIVINKPSGILSVPFDMEDRYTAFHLVNEYIARRNLNEKVHIVHRLDQGTSGVLMFAKNDKVKNLYVTQWNKLAKARVYVAYVEGLVEKDADTIISNLNTDKSAMVYAAKEGKKAISHYQLIETFKGNSILKVNIETGIQNQIRVHMKDLGHPILGDKKYGARTNPLKRLGLHAYQLQIKNPITNKLQTFTANVPKEFRLSKKKI